MHVHLLDTCLILTNATPLQSRENIRSFVFNILCFKVLHVIICLCMWTHNHILMSGVRITIVSNFQQNVSEIGTWLYPQIRAIDQDRNKARKTTSWISKHTFLVNVVKSSYKHGTTIQNLPRREKILKEAGIFYYIDQKTTSWISKSPSGLHYP